jgi:hypothetical protein
VGTIYPAFCNSARFFDSAVNDKALNSDGINVPSETSEPGNGLVKITGKLGSRIAGLADRAYCDPGN